MIHRLVNLRLWTLNTFESEAWIGGNGMERPRDRGLIPEGLWLQSTFCCT